MPTPRPEVLEAIQHYEDPSGAPNATSTAGAIGPMQVMPATAKLYGYDPAALTDPTFNKALGTQIYSDLLKRYGGNERAALIAYNQGTKSFDAGKIVPSAARYADNVLQRASLKPPDTSDIDQAYTARMQQNQDVKDGGDLINAHPEAFKAFMDATGRNDATAGMQPPKSPAEAGAQQQAVEGFSGSEAAKTTGDKAVDFAASLPGSAVEAGLGAVGVSPEHAATAGNITNAAMMGYGLAKGGIAAYKGIKGLMGTGEEAAGAVKPSGIVDAQGNPMASESAVGAAAPPAEGGGASMAPAPAPVATVNRQGLPLEVPEGAMPAPVSAATPEVAAQSLASRQLANLQAVRVGKETATEFGRPDIATTVPEALTMQESAGLRQNLESYYAQGSTPPKLAAHVQALASTYDEENRAIHAFNLDLRTRAAAGEDVTGDLNQLVNRYSAMAENYSTLAGTRSDVGRSLQILDPNKPNNAFVAATAQIAQKINVESSPQKLSDLLAELKPEQLARAQRQLGEDVGMGRSLYNAFNEYYINNLLSNVGRTGSRIGVSNAISAMLTIPRSQIESMLPGSPVKLGEPLARIQGLVDGFWHALDVGFTSLKTGARESQIEGGTVSPFIDAHKAITGQAFGLEGTGMGTAIDYLGNVLRLPGRGLTAVHQFGHSMMTSMETHALAWRTAVNQAATEGANGVEGYTRAQSIYKATLADVPADMRANAAQQADIGTFANKLEGMPAAAQALIQYAPLKQLMPFFKVAYNVKKMGADITPGVGLLTNASDLMSGDPAAKSAAAAKIAFGSLMGVMISHEFHNGNIVLDKYGSPQFKFGDKLVSVPEPLAFPIAMTGNYLQNRDAMSDPDAIDRASQVSRALGTAMANDSIVQGLVNIKKLMTDLNENKPKALQQFAGQEAAGLIPWSAALRGLASATDPLARDPQTMGQEIQTGIPGQSEQVQPRMDVFNQPVPNPAMGIPERLLYPVNISTPSKDPVVNEMARLNVHASYPPQFLDNYPKDKAQWMKDRADGLHDDLSEYVNSADFKKDSDQMRKVQMEHIIARATHVANVGMLADPKLADAIEAHKEALKGYTPDMGAPPTVSNEFGAAGPSENSVPAIQ